MLGNVESDSRSVLKRPVGLAWQDTNTWVPFGYYRHWKCPCCRFESETFEGCVRHIAKICRPWYELKRRHYEEQYDR